MGDDNINTLKQSNISKEYLNLLRSEGFSPLIFEATRATESNQTCIDHIYTSYTTFRYHLPVEVLPWK